MSGAEDALDEALERLAPFGPDLANGLTNHGPMAVEALCALGRAEAVGPFLERYRAGLLPRARPERRIDPDHWQESLGREPRFPDWAAFFTEELAEAPWRAVVARWVPRLAPGFAAAATHGIIRVGHAVRSLEARETPPRLHELADGLGYWAATHQTLPGTPGASRGLAPARAIATVPILPAEERRFEGTITSALAALGDGFAPVIDAVDGGSDPGRTISELAETFARVTLANARDTLTAIVFVHAVTSAAAARSILPHLDARSAALLVRYQWQTAAALYATFATTAPASPARDAPLPSWDDAVDRAVATHDEHAIKFAEACLREHRLSPAPALRLAVPHVTPLL